jgi:hypothetical protein
VPQTQPAGNMTITADFDSGPFAGLLHATMTIKVNP